MCFQGYSTVLKGYCQNGDLLKVQMLFDTVKSKNATENAFASPRYS